MRCSSSWECRPNAGAVPPRSIGRHPDVQRAPSDKSCAGSPIKRGVRAHRCYPHPRAGMTGERSKVTQSDDLVATDRGNTRQQACTRRAIEGRVSSTCSWRVCVSFVLAMSVFTVARSGLARTIVQPPLLQAAADPEPPSLWRSEWPEFRTSCVVRTLARSDAKVVLAGAAGCGHVRWTNESPKLALVWAPLFTPHHARPYSTHRARPNLQTTGK